MLVPYKNICFTPLTKQPYTVLVSMEMEIANDPLMPPASPIYGKNHLVLSLIETADDKRMTQWLSVAAAKDGDYEKTKYLYNVIYHAVTSLNEQETLLQIARNEVAIELINQAVEEEAAGKYTSRLNQRVIDGLMDSFSSEQGLGKMPEDVDYVFEDQASIVVKRLTETNQKIYQRMGCPSRQCAGNVFIPPAEDAGAQVSLNIAR